MRKFIVLAMLPMFLGGLMQANAQDKAEKRTAAEEKAIAAVRQMGGHVLDVAQSDKRLEVAYHLADGKVTGKHLAPLKDLKGSLSLLNLRGTAITDADLAQLKDLSALTRLHLEKTAITDAGLVHLKGLANLEYLNLYGTQVTDAGLDQLVGLKKLKKLYIWQSKVTIVGVAKTQKTLPGLQIIPDLVADKKKEEARQIIIAEAKKQLDGLTKKAAAAKAAGDAETKKSAAATAAAAAAKKAYDAETKKVADLAKAADVAKKKAAAAKTAADAATKAAAAAKAKADAATKASADAAKQLADVQATIKAAGG